MRVTRRWPLRDDLRVVCPFVTIHPATEAALIAHAPQVERISVAHSDLAYCELLTRLWAEGESFLIVEHDIEIHAAVVPDAVACPEPWCVWPFPGPGFWDTAGNDPLLYESLGCTRFSAALMAAEPDALTVAGAMNAGLRAGDWRRMDVSILPTLRARGYEPHTHWPAVVHHHRYSAGCSCGEEGCAA
jgi:hypothetical protein